MRKQILRRPSPAMIVAVLALCLAVGGSAYAGVKLKLGKNAVKTKNIKNGAVTKSKIAAGAVSADKLAAGAVSPASISPAAKTLWVETTLGSNTTIKNQSGGITLTQGPLTGETIVNFGTNVNDRAISVTPNLTLGSVNAEYGRCVDIGCGAASGNPNAIGVFTFISNTGNLANLGFLASALP
jgi:hypothetical protein